MATLEWHTEGLFRRLRAVKSEAVRQMERGAKAAIERFQQTVVTRRLSMQTDDSLGARTGALRRSLKARTTRSGHEIIARCWFHGAKAQMLARVHEEGTKIFAKPGGWLKVPLGDALTKTGRIRKAAQGRQPGQFIFKSKTGQLFIAQRVGKGKRARLKLLYILKKSVQEKPRLHFFQTWLQFQPQVRAILRAAQARAYRKAAG
ncbi:MAG: hypothetical protein JXQ29_18645 [Planctomycetes bacterium]|nr:hypothetical protein [Planctomycetota bacterium]